MIKRSLEFRTLKFKSHLFLQLKSFLNPYNSLRGHRAETEKVLIKKIIFSESGGKTPLQNLHLYRKKYVE